MKKTNGEKSRPVLVTTEHKGVFVGMTKDAPDAETVTLENCRMIVYWTADCHGVLGIAKRGVTRGCRVTPALDKVTLRNITAVMEATPEAAKSWDAEPWS